MNFERIHILKKYNFHLYGLTSIRFKSYSHSVFLPKTDFPLRLQNKSLVERDKYINEVANPNYLYNWQRRHLSEPEFVLHDGPPYANGLPHMGHAINKILKDIILRYQILKGRKVHYIPGWDCHGLPVELRALDSSKSKTENALEIRRKARQFAREAIENQKKNFISWGVLGDWNNCYTSFTVDYMKNQFKQFYSLYSKNFIYRDIKPIHWSPSTKTALAESELEYNEHHKSPSIYVQFEIERMPTFQNPHNKPIFALIWTTTPWTLPANQGVCYNPDLTYCLCTKDSGKTLFIVAIKLIEELKSIFGCEIHILATLPDGILSEANYRHPLYKDQVLSFFAGSHVTATTGTGLVHTAPAHGPEDFLIALENKLSIVNLVNDEGCYNKDAGPSLEGKFVLDEGNEAIIEMLKENLVHISEITHSYPYDWRSKKPVIMKASKQWFLDTNCVKNRAIESLDKVTFLPSSKKEIYKEQFLKQIKKRPFWCISRQRKWGIPIPVFYEKNTDKVILNENIINHQCQLLENNGPDYWWTLPEENLLPKQSENCTDTSKIKKGEDILDIWFDSGISWSKVLGINKVADIYLEGGDQLNGWFYSSLITSLACRDIPPYQSLYIHGFAVDENGMKMSKSLGNVVDPLNVMEGNKRLEPYGVDVLRWWVSCHANQESLVYVSDNVLQSCSVEVQKIRSVLRFILGALKDYEEEKQDIPLLFTDKYILHVLYEFFYQVKKDYEEYAFSRIGKSVVNLLSNDISALYYSAVKDRLYCDSQNSLTRKSAQFGLHQIFKVVSLSVAPLLPHLIEELYVYFPVKKGDTYFTSSHEGVQETWKNEHVKRIMNIILDIRKNLNIQVGTSSISMDVNIFLSKEIFDEFQSLTSADLNYEIANILHCAKVDITCDATLSKDYQIEISRSERFLCPRCRRTQSENKDEPCCRCSNVLNNFNKERIQI